jgi:hypothetical protein
MVLGVLGNPETLALGGCPAESHCLLFCSAERLRFPPLTLLGIAVMNLVALSAARIPADLVPTLDPVLDWNRDRTRLPGDLDLCLGR